jgi:putative protease
MHRIVDAARDAHLSAIIASDMATILYARSIGVEVHISTQVNVSNSEAVRYYAQWADVMVLARELNLDQVKKIHKTIVNEKITGPAGELIRIEMFAHGALCMAVSGKCYMSLHEYNRSANRGACAQVCRHAYDAFAIDSETQYRLDDQDHDIQLKIDNKYIMSPKDLKTIHFVNKMKDAGVEVYKIEGRARGPEYVKTVVSCYREAFEAIEDGSYGAEKIAEWDKRLSTVFNRGFWNGYYLGQRLGEWSDTYGSKATEKKIYAAKTMGWYSRICIGDFLCEAEELHKGNKILIIGPTTGVIETTLDEIQVDYKVVETVHKGDRFTIPVKDKIRLSDKLFVIRKESE